ncbi:hypothetical protein CMI37_14880 [Candidatus Pacearchaeota archaeon]|nr:hypothetical protein [Candidatus Pacearchaeota archaeon]
MDGDVVQAVVAAIGPAGVIVLAALWLLTRRRDRQNGASRCPSACPPIVVARLDAVRDDLLDLKSDVRDLRANLVRHLEDHAHV